MATSIVSDAQVQALRFHLGYGNVSVGAYPYTPDGFYELFTTVIAPNLQSGNETSATTAITAGSIAVVTPVDMTGIATYVRLVVDVGPFVETVTVAAVTSLTFSAYFVNAHAASGYPIVMDSGVQRLRTLINAADTAWQRIQDAELGYIGGLKSTDKGDVVWQDTKRANLPLDAARSQYEAIQKSLSALVRVDICGDEASGNSGSTSLEPY